jgi:predicted TPR repeat methyltransferase
LAVSDLHDFLAGEADAQARYHLVLASDVFAYVKDLGAIAAAVARILAAGGLFAFTVEWNPDDAVVLQQTLRYAHGELHVRSLIAAAGLTLERLASVSTRTENGVPVPGLLAVARR